MTKHGRQRERRPPRLDETERGDDDQERGRVEHRADHGPDRLPHRDVLGLTGVDEHRVVHLRRSAASRRRSSRRRTRRSSPTPPAAPARRRPRTRSSPPSNVTSPIELLQRVDEEEEVEERLEEAGEEDHPRPAVDHDVPLDEQQAAAARARRRAVRRRPSDVARSSDERASCRYVNRAARARPR